MSRNNGQRKKKTDLKTLVEVIFIILDAATLGTIFVFIGHDAGGPFECTAANGLCKGTPQTFTSLGVWKNFPPASSCTTGNFTGLACELMGNTTYRQPLSYGGVNIEAAVQVILTVSCITPSNTVGAFLQLQYANFSLTTNLNTSIFVNVPGSLGAGQVFIDNSANNPCPGNIVSSRTLGVALPAGVGAFIFRVVGSSGGGTGDNPRFSSITTTVFQLLNRIPGGFASSVSTTGFTANVRILYPAATAAVISFQWVATTDGVLTHSGSGSCTVAVGGLTCTASQTFSSAFAATPNVVVTPTTFINIIIPVASLTFLSAQTVTV